MYLTVELLRKYGAREEKVQEFVGRFPNGVEALDFLDECYAAEHLLSLDDAIDDILIITRRNGGTI